MVPAGIKGTRRMETGRNVGGDFISTASGDGSGTNNPKTASQPWQVSTTCESVSGRTSQFASKSEPCFSYSLSHEPGKVGGGGLYNTHLSLPFCRDDHYFPLTHSFPTSFRLQFHQSVTRKE